MKALGHGVPVAFVTLLGTLLVIQSSSRSIADEPIEDETCLMCHEGVDSSLLSTPHALSSEIKGPALAIWCTSCHEGGEVHIEEPSWENIENPARLAGRDVKRVCTRCHTAHDRLDNYGFDTHSVEELGCAECHKVHGGARSLLLDDRARFCFKCHEAKRHEFSRNSNHPLLQGNITCLDCHMFTKRADADLAYDLGWTCRHCHPEQGGPFVYEHEAVNAYSVEGSGCIECHEPHGSENNRLLKQPGNQLCRQCHYPIGHATEHGGIWSKYACRECHVDTHGSFVSNLYLDPNLPEKLGGDCFNSGCHSLNR